MNKQGHGSARKGHGNVVTDRIFAKRKFVALFIWQSSTINFSLQSCVKKLITSG